MIGEWTKCVLVATGLVAMPALAFAQDDRLVDFIDRRPVSDIKVPIGFDDPMYMIANLAIGPKFLLVDAKSPASVAFGIDRTSTYQIGTAPPGDTHVR